MHSPTAYSSWPVHSSVQCSWPCPPACLPALPAAPCSTLTAQHCLPARCRRKLLPPPLVLLLQGWTWRYSGASRSSSCPLPLGAPTSMAHTPQQAASGQRISPSPMPSSWTEVCAALHSLHPSLRPASHLLCAALRGLVLLALRMLVVEVAVVVVHGRAANASAQSGPLPRCACCGPHLVPSTVHCLVHWQLACLPVPTICPFVAASYVCRAERGPL